MSAFIQKIVAFFMAVSAFFSGLFGLNKTPDAPAQPETPALQNVKYIAHRGATFAAPENTLPAVEAAARDDCAGVELDVRQTGDGVLVLSHNKTLNGLVNGVETTRVIGDSTYASLCEISLGKNGAGDVRIPTLEQALTLLRSLGLEAVIHCKVQTDGFLRQVARTVTACGMSGRCAYNTDRDFQTAIPAVLGEDAAAVFHVPYAEALADASVRALVPRPGAVVATVDVSALTADVAARIREQGFSFYVWNVTAENVSAALAAAPDYVEFVSGVRVKDLPAGA